MARFSGEGPETRPGLREAAPGGRDPLRSTGPGKAILAARPSATRLDGLPPLPSRRTPGTLTCRTALALDLARTAEQGFALEIEENEPGARCVAVAIPGTAPPGALSISSPAVRMPPEKAARLGQSPSRAAAIAARLG